MTNLSSFNTPTPIGSSVRSVTLLTPPQSPSLSEDTPFKPKEDDIVSLSMKKGHHSRADTQSKNKSRRKLNRTCLSTEELRTIPSEKRNTRRPYSSKSLPTLAISTTFLPATKPVPTPKNVDTGSLDQKRRRWTLPSKAAPTRSRAMTISAEHKPTTITSPDCSGLLSPAMITLRRATTVKKPDKKMSLTFFPEPKFERSRTGFLATFLRTMTGMPNKSNEASWPRVEERRSSTVSMGSEGAQPSHRGSADTVCTRVVDVQPTISQPSGSSHQSSVNPFGRRCSTKYITGDQVYEVIWDENTSSHSESTPAPEAGAATYPPDSRRQSVAMDLLEAQLLKASVQSRRQSQIIQESEERKSSFNEAYERQRHGSIQSILGFKLSRFVNDAPLQDVPRSKSSRRGKGRSPHTSSISRVSSAVAEGASEAPHFKQMACAMEFFPPLRSRATTSTSKADSYTSTEQLVVFGETTVQHDSKSITPPGPCSDSRGSFAGPIGSKVGASTHIRRRRTTPVINGTRRKRDWTFTDSRRASATGMPALKTTVEDETTPLLTFVGMLE